MQLEREQGAGIGEAAGVGAGVAGVGGGKKTGKKPGKLAQEWIIIRCLGEPIIAIDM